MAVVRSFWLAAVALSAAIGVAPTTAPSAGAQRACQTSHVRYTPYTGPDATGLASIPWIQSADGTFVGHLFYYGSVPWAKERRLGARIYTTVRPHPFNPKVLWTWVPERRGYTRTLTIAGRRLDAPGSFTARYPGFRDYPSYVEVPHSGCWRVTVSTGGRSGRFVFSALD